MLVDMHLHECTYSTDSFLHLEEIVSIARQKGLDAICITDHDSMGLRERAEAYSREIGYPIFVGVEFFSLWGDITAWGIDGIPDQRVSAQDFIDLVREKDGFCVSWECISCLFCWKSEFIQPCLSFTIKNGKEQP